MERKYNHSYSFDKGFPLSNCVLYYLGWYYRSGDMWADLKKCMTADGYCGKYMSKHDILRLLLGVAEEWNLYAANNGYNLIRLSHILVSDWQIAGWEKYDKDEPRMLSMVWNLLGIFALDYKRTELPLKKPHFSKENELKPRNYKHGQTYKQANKEMEKYHWTV